MALKKVVVTDDTDLTMEVSEEALENFFDQVEASLRAHGWKGTRNKNMTVSSLMRDLEGKKNI